MKGGTLDRQLSSETFLLMCWSSILVRVVQSSVLSYLGMSIRPSGYLSSSGDRKMIARAVVRWMEGKECGVKLERMEPEPAAQRSHFFSTLSEHVKIRSIAA